MSRRIAYLFVIASAATLAAPASADRECFDNTCRMPEVIELPEAPPAAAEPSDPASIDTASASAARAASAATATAPVPVVRRGEAPDPIRPQMAVDALPRPALKPSPYRPVEPARSVEAAAAPVAKPVRATARPTPPRQTDVPSEPVEVVSRQYAQVEQQGYQQIYVPQTQPGAGVVVVVPGVQYGADGVGLKQGLQDSAWELCQKDRRSEGRCTPYDYQPYGAYGYRPLGSYRPQHAAPAYVYVPDAKIISIDVSNESPISK